MRKAGRIENIGAGNEARTRDLNLGKVALYQLSYSRTQQRRNCRAAPLRVKENSAQFEAKALNWRAISMRWLRYWAAYSRELSRNSGQARRKYRIIDHSVSTAAMAVKTTPSL